MEERRSRWPPRRLRAGRGFNTTREAQPGEAAKDQIRQRSDNDDVEVMELDLAQLASVRDFASRFTAGHDHIDVLLNNAGVMLGFPARDSVDGLPR